MKQAIYFSIVEQKRLEYLKNTTAIYKNSMQPLKLLENLRDEKQEVCLIIQIKHLLRIVLSILQQICYLYTIV